MELGTGIMPKMFRICVTSTVTFISGLRFTANKFSMALSHICGLKPLFADNHIELCGPSFVQDPPCHLIFVGYDNCRVEKVVFVSVVKFDKAITVLGILQLDCPEGMLWENSRRFGVRTVCKGFPSTVPFKSPFVLSVSVGLDRFGLTCSCLLNTFCLPATGMIAAISGARVHPLVQDGVILL